MSKSKSFKPDPLAHELVELAERYHTAKVWRRISDQEPFIVWREEPERPILVTALGQGDGNPGLMISTDERSLGEIRTWISNGQAPEDAEFGFDCMMMFYQPMRDLEPAMKRFVESGGMRGDGTRLAPTMFAKDAHCVPRLLRRPEMRTLATALRATLLAEKSGVLKPQFLDPAQRKILCLRTDLERRSVAASTVQISDWFLSRGAPVVPAALPPELAALPRREWEALCVGTALPAGIKNDPRAYFMVTIIRANDGEMLGSGVAAGAEDAEIAEILASTFRGDKAAGEPLGLPAKLIFVNERWYRTFEGALRGLGVEPVLDPSHPGMAHLDDLRQAIRAATGVDLPTGDGGDRGQSDDDGDAAAARSGQESLAYWKQMELRAIKKWAPRAWEDLDSPAARKTYFDRSEIPKDATEQWGSEAVISSYIEWLIADYPATATGKTYIESMLARPGVPEHERRIYQSRQNRVLSLFRVLSIDEGRGLELEDVVDRKVYFLTDNALSRSIPPGLFLMMRLFPIADWYFGMPAGPPIAARHADIVLEAMDAIPADETPATKERMKALLFGRNWQFIAEALRHKPELRNTDNDELEHLTAHFTVSDYDALKAALGKRRDVEPADGEAQPHEWRWFGTKRIGPDQTPVTRGRLQLIGDELILEVNSRKRLDKARKWLEKIDGVRFESVRAHAEEELAPDDRMAAAEDSAQPIPDEIVEQLLPKFRAMLERWVDEVVPALSNRTPREACKTPEGRRTVYRMIQTMPNPMANPELRARLPFDEVRAGMLRELGLEGGPGA